jgi:hypothetical protein
MLRFLSRRDRPGLGKEVEPIVELALDTSRQLGGWLESLKNSDARGPRHRTDATRRQEESVRRQAEYLEKPERIQEEARRSNEDGTR